jgi:hypothetical protein
MKIDRCSAESLRASHANCCSAKGRNLVALSLRNRFICANRTAAFLRSPLHLISSGGYEPLRY